MSVMLKITAIIAVAYLFMNYIVVKGWVNSLSTLDLLRWKSNNYTTAELIVIAFTALLRLATYICAGITIIAVVCAYL